MSRTSPILGFGEQTVEIGGATLVLKPTLGAALKINAAFGGYQPALERIAAIDLAAISAVLAAGAGIAEPRALDELTADLFTAGVARFVGPATLFVGALATGGVGSKPSAAEGGEGNA